MCGHMHVQSIEARRHVCMCTHACIDPCIHAGAARMHLSLSLDHACVHALTYMFLYMYIYIYVHIEMVFAMHARVPGRGYDMSGRARLTLRNARMRKTAFPACVHAYACDYIYLCIYLNLYVYAYNIRPRVRLHRSCMHK